MSQNSNIAYSSSAVFATLSVCALLLTGCDSSSSGIEDVSVMVQGNQCSFLLASVDEPVADYHIDLVLAFERSGCLPREATIRAIVFGFDNLIADASATALIDVELAARAPGEIYSLRFAADAFDRIEFQSGATDALGFYVNLTVDINGDGIICNGDFRQDFDRSRLQFFDLSNQRINHELYITVIDNLPCSTV